MKIKVLSIVICIFCLSATIKAEKFTVESPDSKVKLQVAIGESIEYSVTFNGIQIVKPSTILFSYKQAPFLGTDMKVLDSEEYIFDKTW